MLLNSFHPLKILLTYKRQLIRTLTSNGFIGDADNSYREQFSVLKSAEIYDVAALEYGMDEKIVIERKAILWS